MELTESAAAAAARKLREAEQVRIGEVARLDREAQVAEEARIATQQASIARRVELAQLPLLRLQAEREKIVTLFDGVIPNTDRIINDCFDGNVPKTLPFETLEDKKAALLLTIYYMTNIAVVVLSSPGLSKDKGFNFHLAHAKYLTCLAHAIRDGDTEALKKLTQQKGQGCAINRIQELVVNVFLGRTDVGGGGGADAPSNCP